MLCLDTMGHTKDTAKYNMEYLLNWKELLMILFKKNKGIQQTQFLERQVLYSSPH